MNKELRLYILFISLFWSFYTQSQTTLTHNYGDDIIETSIYACSWGNVRWARTFVLQDFGIDTTEEFVINKGVIGLSQIGTWDVNVQFNIFEIDSNFPDSFSTANLIGSSQIFPVPYFSSWNPQIFTIDFTNPIVIPENVEMILVEVHQLSSTASSAVAFAAGTECDDDFSWFQAGAGCGPFTYTNTEDLGYADAKFYIKVIGEINNITIPFTMNYSIECDNLQKYFYINNTSGIASILWDFGDPVSGGNNFSTHINTSHIFSSDGQFTVTATIIDTFGNTYTLQETIYAANPPEVFSADNLYACEDILNSGLSSQFDTALVHSQLLNGRDNVEINYFDGNGNSLPSPLPNPLSNSISNNETITVKLSYDNSPCCIAETSFNLITNPLPEIVQINNIQSCDNDEDGFTIFDLSNVPIDLVNGQPDLTVELYDSNNNIIPTSNYSNFENLSVNQDYIKAVVTNSTTNCSSETNITLIVNGIPTANVLQVIYGCDDNNDGISEYFDTSNVENQVLNGQTGMTVSYYDQNGNSLPSPLPNPFTNSNLNNELITVRVTDSNSTCFAETTLQIQTVTQPSINQPNNLYACDQGNGYAMFDTSTIEQQIIGNQTGLTIHYFDSNNNPLPSPLPLSFQNTEPFSQTINVVVEDASNPICYSETAFNLIVSNLPEVSLEEEYFICNLDPSIFLSVSPSFNTYEWYFEDGSLISSTYSAQIIEEGNYTLTVTQLENGISCENSFSFRLIRSVLPEIQQVNYGELGNNFIEIIASGDGDFEYSINGSNYQEGNYFPNVQGGIYTVFVRDKEGCGEDSQEVTIIDYPKFFTPNGDGYNDFWQIKGISNYPNSQIVIFDRYGKVITQLSSNSFGWDGTLNGEKMISNDYWFTVDLGNGEFFKGHFSLKR